VPHRDATISPAWRGEGDSATGGACSLWRPGCARVPRQAGLRLRWSSPSWSEQRWTRGWVEAEARRRGSTPGEQLLAIFELFDEWFHRDDFEACSFINVLLELGAAHPAGRASIEHLENICSVVRQLAEEASLSDPDSFAHSWHILMKGSIVSAAEGDPDAAQRAKAMARRLIEDHSQSAAAVAGLA